MGNSEDICTKLLIHGKVIAAVHGNMVVTVTSGDGIFGLTLRENKPRKKNVLMPRRGAGARKRRAEKRLLARKTSGNDDENAEISVLENDDSTPTPEQNQTTNLVRDTVGPNHGDPNPNTAEEMQHLHDTASLDNRNVDPKMSNAGNDQVRIENQSRTQKTFCIKQTLKESLW